MLTNRCEKKLVVLLINQKDYELYNQQTSTNEIRFTRYADAIFESRTKRAQKELIMQNKANFPNAQILVNCVLIRDCVNIRLHRRFKNKAKQTQFKANSNPIQTQFKPNQTQFQTSPAQQFHNFAFRFFTFYLLPLPANFAFLLSQGVPFPETAVRIALNSLVRVGQFQAFLSKAAVGFIPLDAYIMSV